MNKGQLLVKIADPYISASMNVSIYLNAYREIKNPPTTKVIDGFCVIVVGFGNI